MGNKKQNWKTFHRRSLFSCSLWGWLTAYHSASEALNCCKTTNLDIAVATELEFAYEIELDFTIHSFLSFFSILLFFISLFFFTPHSTFHSPHNTHKSLPSRSFNSNFAIYGIMDIIHGTTGGFDYSDNGRHHKTLYTLKSARELFDSDDSRRAEKCE